MGALQPALPLTSVPNMHMFSCLLAGDSDILRAYDAWTRALAGAEVLWARIGNLSDRLSAVEASFDVVYARKQLV